MKTFEYIVCGKKEISMNKYWSGPQFMILWNRNGLYGILPLALLKNIFDSYPIEKIGKSTTQRTVHWHETIKVPASVAKLFLGENENEQCDYKTKSGTQS